MSGGQPAFEPDRADSGADSDRLPWLEPYREPVPKAPVSSALTPNKPRAFADPFRRRSMPGLFLGALAALALGAGGYWVGRVSAPAEPQSSQSTVVATLPYRSLDDQPAEPVLTGDGNGVAAGAADAADVIAAPAGTPHRTAAHQHSVMPRIAHRAAPRVVVRHKAYRHAAPAPPPPPPPPLPRKLQRRTTPTAPAVLGKAGEVIELGVFISPRSAQAALHRVVHRYPYLGTRPRLVLPQAASAGWPAVYRLRLGTGSGRNARILCRYVHSIGQRCAVV